MVTEGWPGGFYLEMEMRTRLLQGRLRTSCNKSRLGKEDNIRKHSFRLLGGKDDKKMPGLYAKIHYPPGERRGNDRLAGKEKCGNLREYVEFPSSFPFQPLNLTETGLIGKQCPG